MIVNPSYFRKIGRDMLKNDWQTPLWVTFLTGIFLTAVSTLYNLIFLHLLDGTTDLLYSFTGSASAGNLNDIVRFGVELRQKLNANLQGIPNGLWIAFFACIVLGLALTPALKLSEHHYYLLRHANKEPQLAEGVLWGFRFFGKAWGLYALIVLKVLLWALIVIPVAALLGFAGGVNTMGMFFLYAALIPALLAVMRYLFAPHVMAENPELGIRECLNRSKTMTAKRKGAIFAVGLSFVLYQMVLTLVLSLLEGMGLPNAAVMVISLFVSLILSVYSVSTFTALYLVFAHPEVEQAMNRFLRGVMQSKGMDEDMIDHMINGSRPDFRVKKDEGGAEDSKETDEGTEDSDDESLN